MAGNTAADDCDGLPGVARIEALMAGAAARYQATLAI